MTKTHKLLSIAALFAAGALTISCNSLKEQLDTPEEIPTTGKTVTLTATVGLGATTKALDATGAKTFAVDDQIAVIYKQEGGTTAKAVTNALTIDDIREEGQKADITVTLDTPAEDGDIRYIYPASMALATIAAADPIDDAHTIDFTQLSAQDGTLATLAGSYDLAVFDGSLNGLDLPESALLSNQLAIGEFTIKNWGGTAITTDLTAFSVTDGTNTYDISPASPATNLTGPIYVAMLPVSDTQELTFTATDGTYTYTRSITGKALAKNNMYPVNLKMSRLVDLATVTANTTLLDGDFVTGTLDVANYPVQISIADDASVTLSNVTIIGIDDASYSWAGITCTGDATITLSGTNTVTGFEWEYPGIQAGPAGTTLTIQGTGSLTASCNSIDSGVAAGIGAALDIPCGNIVIAGGNITANGAADAAGIGGAPNGACGDITISGGTVIARCAAEYTDGPGIGSGINAACGNITISGGNVTATASNYYGAGIGTGGVNSTCGIILISGGTVVATGSDEGPGIGAGFRNCTCGTITIGAGITSVTATRGSKTRTGDSSHTDPCIGAVVVPGVGSNNCGFIFFGTSQMTTNQQTKSNPLTFLKWSPWPTSGSDYGGLHIEISNEERTWTLTPASS